MKDNHLFSSGCIFENSYAFLIVLLDSLQVCFGFTQLAAMVFAVNIFPTISHHYWIVESIGRGLDSRANMLDSRTNMLDSGANRLDSRANMLDSRANMVDCEASMLESRANRLDVRAIRLEVVKYA